ncbi:MAG: iron-sulfur binding protein [Bacteroidetes bacterium]|nr:iron-sulfur binding protein [Bacteroidota bacterium]
MIRKILQWIVFCVFLGTLVFFSIKQYRISHPEEVKATSEISNSQQDTTNSSCIEQSCGSCPSKENCTGKGSNASIPPSTGKEEFKAPSGDEFSEVSSTETEKKEEFKEGSNDEFQDASGSEFQEVSNDEFQEVSNDEFQNRADVTNAVPAKTEKVKIDWVKYYPTFIRFSILFMLLAIISIFYHTKWIHYFRYPILLGSLVYFGFILGGCPCILVMFNDMLLLFSGKLSLVVYPIILLIIIIMTILFGKIWCGWLCHFGALQEFLFRNPRMQLLRSKIAQKVLHIIQRATFIAFGIWILVAQINIVCTYDPFVKIFTLSASGWLAYLLVGILILSSVLIYRPFCRAICPVGMLLNLTTKLPFANKIVLDGCTECKKCHKYCKMGSIHDKKVDMACIACGECNQSKCEGIKLMS